VTTRSELARIVARESAETIVGHEAGRRVSAVRRVLRPAAELIARRFVEYDDALAERGAVGGAEWIVSRATGGVAVSGAANMPATGPALVVSNHPGLADAVALLAAMRRDDAWIVTADYPFLRAMRRASSRFLFVDGRCTTLRHIVRRLRDGQAVLLFPAGGLEPDPALAREDALASLGGWSRSIELIARLVPGVRVVPGVVSGAVSRNAFDHPLARRRTPTRERQRLASLFQLAFTRYQRGTVSVTLGTAISARADVVSAVHQTMRDLMETTAI
jgi:1-acyl-sn-glycerol-3-phosphate acyltransferase